ncbi:hypothetical protein DL764_003956 [Monosporascus ibericus]|uniref:MYST-type HAT domain-containing protein n=1 Tax=Monosporascus ibericus TaxID=155417 RepID=A0A4V1XB73_9PEZI|nr:hypothetical protein DL764_003956 [Monosporascus ibericus]
MPPQKRKRPQDDPADSTAQPIQAQPQAPTRRVTRRNPQGLLDDEKHQLRSGRVRAGALEKSIVVEPAPEPARGRKADAPKNSPDPSAVVPAKQTRKTRLATAHTEPSKENIEAPSKPQTTSTVAPPPKLLTSHDGPSHSAVRTRSPLPHSRTQSRAVLPKSCPQQRPLNNRIPSSSAAAVAASAAAPVTPKRAALAEKPLKQQQPPPTPRSDRNIDKVVLGDICFKAWYPSYYGKEVLGDVSGNAGGGKDMGARMVGGGGKRDPPVLDRLYVCPCCFKYSKELVAWWEHVRCCERKGTVPGRKVYTHPKGKVVRKTTASTAGSAAGNKGKGKKRGEVAAPTVEDNTEEEGEWSVWEVDGESERNLSLFAKLFLDNKSVFFDVSGFNYFLLVYTPHNAPPEAAAQQTPSSFSSNPDQDPQAPSPPTPPTITSPSSSSPRRPRPHIVGFFSKEKMSWDNNNLACILVFPPWQRKGLGSVLMGVSYEISRREGVLGGPEKPISELGRRGYRSFWAGEIARWLLGLEVRPPSASSPPSSSVTTIPSSTASSSESSSGAAGGGGEGGEDEGGGGEKGSRKAEGKARETQPLVVDVQMCSRATWIAPEDCLLVLREMGVVEEASPEPPGPNNTTVAPESAAAASSASVEAEDAAAKDGGPVAVSASPPRVRIDKAAVRRWVEANGIGLERTCDPDGFLEGYAVKEAQLPDDEVGE